ncbi:MAG: dihydropteroate synthase [Deltaproteobacteria bacterium]|nr:dihydropteroate synthase [Deltaproteobacteria bacterium]
MGVVNVTPDSFSDGGSFASTDAAVARALELAELGADVIDIGGESTRPGSQGVALEEELSRVIPVVERVVREVSVPVSVDTHKAEVARRAVDVGAAIVNDVTALRGDPQMARTVARAKVPIVLMHALWPPATMQEQPAYVDVVEDVAWFLEERARFAMGFGIERDRIVVDPGIGFGKTLEHNLALLRDLPRLAALGYPLLVGPSRKSFLGMLLDRPVDQRLAGTAGAVALCAALGAHLVRVHDVREMRDVVRVVDAVVWQV